MFALEASNDYMFRFLLEVKSIAMQFWFLVYEQPAVPCKHRCKLAKDLLARKREGGNNAKVRAPMTWKLAACFEADLNQCVHTHGTYTPRGSPSLYPNTSTDDDC